MSESINKTPEPAINNNIPSPKASTPLKIISFSLAVALATLFGIQQYIVSGGGIPEAIGGSVGGVIWPLAVVMLFQIGKRFRNQNSRHKIFVLTAAFILVAMIFRFISLAAKIAAA